MAGYKLRQHVLEFFDKCMDKIVETDTPAAHRLWSPAYFTEEALERDSHRIDDLYLLYHLDRLVNLKKGATDVVSAFSCALPIHS